MVHEFLPLREGLEAVEEGAIVAVRAGELEDGEDQEVQAEEVRVGFGPGGPLVR